MKNSGFYSFKVILIAVCLILIQAATVYLLYANSASVLRDQYRVSAEKAVENSAEIIGNRFSGNLTDFDKLGDERYIAQKYVLSGVFAEGILTSGGQTYNPSATAKQNLSNQKIFFIPEAELTGGGQNKMLIIYARQKEDGGVLVLAQTPESFVSGLTHDTFGGFFLVKALGQIIAGTTDEYSRLTDFMDGDVPGAIEAGATNSIDVAVAGEAQILVVSPVTVSGAGELKLYAAGYISYAHVAKVIADANFKNILALAVFSGAVAILMLALGLAMKKQNDYLRGYNMGTKDKYILIIDSMGRIKKSNKAFGDTFLTCNIFDNMVFFEEGKPVRDGDSIIVYAFNKENEKRLINFFVAKIPGGFKLVGVDATGVLENTNINILTHAMLSAKDLLGQFNRDKLFNSKLLLGIIDIVNLKNLDLMFGRPFAEKVSDIVGKRIRKRFVKVYEMPGGSMGVLVSVPKEIDYTMKDLTIIMDSFSQAVLVDDYLVNVNCKAGFAICDEIMTDKSFDYVVNCANAALKRAKKEERLSYYVYHESQKKFYVRLLEKHWDIKAMLQANSFEMGFQPQYLLASDKPYGFEALFRVKKALSLEVDIFELITYAERTGNMILLGEFIFDEGMKFAKSIEGTGVHVSLNVSPVQLMQAGFVESFLKIYNKYNLKPNSISIEITESFLMTNFDETLAKLKILEKNGIDIHLDDFGVSYSSMLYLKKLPISAIKIDREFIADIENNPYSRAITKTIVDITKQLGQLCISEGVETEGQKEILRVMGCDVIQGFLMGKAMPADDARRLLHD